jgi:hypothetical protein
VLECALGKATTDDRWDSETWKHKRKTEGKILAFLVMKIFDFVHHGGGGV